VTGAVQIAIEVEADLDADGAARRGRRPRVDEGARVEHEVRAVQKVDEHERFDTDAVAARRRGDLRAGPRAERPRRERVVPFPHRPNRRRRS